MIQDPKGLQYRRQFNFGFSLIEVLSGLAVLGIAGYTVSLLSVNLARTSQANRNSADFGNLNTLLRQLFTGPSACLSALDMPKKAIPITELQKKDQKGDLVPFETAIFNGGSPMIYKGLVLGTLTVSATSVRLYSTDPISTLPSGQKNYLGTVQLTANSANSRQFATSPIYVTLSSDSSGQNVVSCGQLSNETPPPQCDGAKGLLLTTVDRVTYTCAPAPKPYASLDVACQSKGGYVITLAEGGSEDLVCIINDSGCPSGFTAYYHYTKTEQNQCFGLSDSGCNMGYLCTTKFHDFANIDPATESCTAGTNRLCGPLTNGTKSCLPLVTKIACRPAMALR